ncbi:hypothetical protein K503DRAFT_771650 [Rhizopogon vinicolor AM-OR11-026]|uniref:Uncharacterized protein n=1 Tax=Rhizopogon vinicolor AM-OR11-026 TaxID=1314800 RepID=A0A1B7MXF1_9AGAM|nr:hypothetical protein K503DRAFT_771650 [Rhizopogon vinicolor AM-OR11-026]
MLSSLTRFTIVLALASSVLGATIPTTPITSSSVTTTATETSEPYHNGGPISILFESSVHERNYSSEALAPTPTAEGGLSAARRSGELWRAREHQTVTVVPAFTVA